MITPKKFDSIRIEKASRVATLSIKLALFNVFDIQPEHTAGS